MKRVGVTLAANALVEKMNAPEWATTVWPVKRQRSVKLVVRVHPQYPLDQLKIPATFMGYRTAVEEDRPGHAGHNARQLANSHLVSVHVTTHCTATASISGAKPF